MSDSDDTDLLLLIPPDFFLVQSPDIDDIDSEEEFLLGEHHLPVEDSVVNDLITHVNELENRICLIESIDNSRLSALENNNLGLNQSYSDPNSYLSKLTLKQQSNYNSMSDSLRMLSGSIDSIQHNHYLKSRNEFVSPPRPRQPFSLPSTPTTDAYYKTEHQPLRLNLNPHLDVNLEDGNKKKHIDAGESENQTPPEKQINFSDKSIYPENQAVILNSKGIPEEKELLGEIDQYLSDVERHGGVLQNKGDSFSKFTFSSDSYQSQQDLTIENGFKTMAANSDNATINNNRSIIHHLDLPEVDKLLKEMEATQNEIEQKLILHNLPKRILNGIPNKSGTDYSLIRDKPNSRYMPDIEFGIKDIYTNNSKKDTGVNIERNYVIEEPSSKQNVLSSYKNDKKTENSNMAVNYSVMQNRHSPASRRRLDIDFRHKDVDKKSSLTSNYKSQDQKMYKVANDSSIVHSVSPKSTQRVESQSQQESVNKPTKYNISKHIGLESLRDKFNMERDRRLQLIQTHDTKQYHSSSIKGDFNPENNQGTNDARHTYEETPLNHEKSPVVIENHMYSLEQKPRSSNLLSLTDLWNKEPVFHSDNPNKLRQKLEEEKYRRQHCEEMIKNLQCRVLEEQEKLAVAVRVDREKDKAIIQLTDAWRKLAKHWGELEEQRHSLAQQLQSEQELHKTKVDEITKKVDRCETEVSQALNLAAGYKEKCEDLTKEKDALKNNLQTRIEDAEKQIEAVSQQNQQFLKERNEMKQHIEEYRKNSEEEKQLLEEVQMELSNVKKQLSQYEAEINVLTEQKQSLGEKLKDEKAHNNTLEQQKLGLQQALDESKKKEKTAKDEARMYGERIEVARTELRALYQGQLEAVVREKLREFQNQLDAAEAALKAELQAREKLWAEKANNQCKILSEKYKADLHHIQNQHKEELKAWKMKVIDCERLKSAIECQLQEETNRRTDIAQRLHGVMETQWRQALKIITHPSSTENNANTTQHSDFDINKDERKSKIHGREQHYDVQLDLKNVHNHGTSVSSAAPRDDLPFGEDGKATYRLADAQPQPDQLKKYIQMLLDRAPGNPVDGREQSNMWYEPVLENRPQSPGSSIGGKWSAFMPLQDDNKKSNSQENGSNSAGTNKPPWK